MATFVVDELLSIQLDKSGAIITIRIKGWRNSGSTLNHKDIEHFNIKGCGAKFEDQHLLNWAFFNKAKTSIHMTTEGGCLATTTLNRGSVKK